MKMKGLTILRNSVIVGIILLACFTPAYSLSVGVTSNPQIKEPVTVALNLTYNATNNETAAHDCQISVYQTGYADAAIRVYRYNPIVPSLVNLKTDGSGYLQFQFLTNDAEYMLYEEYTVKGICAGAVSTDTFYLIPKKEGIWFLNTAFNLRANFAETVGALFVLFALGVIVMFAFVGLPFRQ